MKRRYHQSAMAGILRALFADIANTISIGNKIDANSDYIELLQDSYFAKSIAGEEPRSLKITNELKFNGKWVDDFDEKVTKLEAFTHDDSSIDSVLMMKKFEYHRYSKGENFQMIAIPYTKGYNIHLLLPDSVGTLTSIIQSLNETQWAKHMENMDLHRDIEEPDYDPAVRKTYLWLPKFKIEEEYELTSMAEKLGVKTAFTQQADFSNVTANHSADLFVSNIKQKTSIDINEKKTVASAITEWVELSKLGIDKRKKKPVVVFHCDHPFAYFITDRFGTICFMGIYR